MFFVYKLNCRVSFLDVLLLYFVFCGTCIAAPVTNIPDYENNLTHLSNPLNVYQQLKSQYTQNNPQPASNFFSVSLAESTANIGSYTAVILGNELYFRCHSGSPLSKIPKNGQPAALLNQLQLNQDHMHLISSFTGTLIPVVDIQTRQLVWKTLNASTRSAYHKLAGIHHQAMDSFSKVASFGDMANHKLLESPPEDFFVLKFETQAAELVVYNSYNYQNLVTRYQKNNHQIWQATKIQP